MNRLRIIALLGGFVHVASSMIESWETLSEGLPQLVVLFAVSIAATIFVTVFLREEVARLVRKPDLAVPLGLYLLAHTLLSWSSKLPGFGEALNAGPTWQIFSISYSFTLSVVLWFLLNTILAGWTARLVIDELDGENVDAGAALGALGSWFPQVAIVRVIGSIALYATLSLIFGIMMALLGLGIPGAFLSLALIVPMIFAFNVFALYLIPASVDEPGLARSFGTALWLARASFRSVAAILLGAMILFGSVGIVFGDFFGSSVNVQVRFDLSWIGDIPIACAWEGWFEQIFEIPRLPIITANLHIVLGLTSVILALAFWRRALSARNST